MILGRKCTRNCRFCAVTKGVPEMVDANEPEAIACASADLGLTYVVVTSVTRDDLPDGGAEHFANTIRAIKRHIKDVKVEVLIPDLMGDMDALKTVIDARPDVIGHNVETVPSLYGKIRPMAEYERSLSIIEGIKSLGKDILSKTGLILGVGETEEEVKEVFKDLVQINCDIITIGQYLTPSKMHYPIAEYITPEQFEAYKVIAEQTGLLYAVSSPLTRSSHMAHEAYETAVKRRAAGPAE